jgi:hypothetical protein
MTRVFFLSLHGPGGRFSLEPVLLVIFYITLSKNMADLREQKGGTPLEGKFPVNQENET